MQRLQSLGLLRPGFTAVHATQIDATDLDALSRTGVCVVSCPQASLRMGHGMSPVALLESHGVPVGLGTDSAACAGALDILAEARVAALFGASAVSALRMATLGSAMALGMGSLVGSIEAGKAADFVCFDLGSLAFQPQVRAADAVLYSATRANVCDVWTSGRRAVSEGRLLAFDEQEISALARQWAERLRLEIPL